MARRVVMPREEHPLLDIASYGRGGQGRRDRLPRAHVDYIRRTVKRVPEAVVKVLPKPANTLRSARKHLDYVGRYGELAVETDDAQEVSGEGQGRRLLEDWDLDLDEHRRQASLAAANGREPPRLVHKLMLSMPPGTPPQGVLAAARNFLREQFALQHRYAFTLHTDEAHPHVHAVIKAVSEQGVRLHIRKATLREWRREFARHLREMGIAANATERAVRGQSASHKSDGIYRAAKRGESTQVRERVEQVAAELLKGGLRIEPGKEKMVRTRNEVERRWRAAADMLLNEGQRDLAEGVNRFIAQMQPPKTEKEQIAAEILQRAHQPRPPDKQRSR